MTTSPLRLTASLTLLLLGSVFAPITSADTAAAQSTALPEVLDATGFNKNFARSNATYLGGQPDAEGMQRLADAGVAAMVNLRTAGEMDALAASGFDETAQADSHGMGLYNIPLREADSFTPEVVQQFSEIYDAHDGNVFLHCASGRRVNYLWTAFLVRHKGLSIEEAQRRIAASGSDTAPLQSLLGEPLPQ